MAACVRRRVLSLSATPALAIGGGGPPLQSLLSLCSYYSSSSSSSSGGGGDNPLLRKLLQLPISQVKSTLDSSVDIFGLRSPQFPWDSLVTSLRSSSPQKTHQVLEWRLERMISDRERNHDQYSNLISLCAKVRSVSLAMRVFTSMEGHGIEPNAHIFNALIVACLSSGDVILALGLFEVMLGSDRYKPNSETYDAFVSGFSNLGDVNKMEAWFVAKKDAGFCVSVENYEALVFGCVKAKDFESSDRFYEEMIASGVMPSALVLEYMVEGLCKRRDCDRVKEFLKFLLECRFEIKGEMIDHVVGLYFDLRKADEMEGLLETLMEFNLVGEALMRVHSGIIRLYAVLDRLDDVEFSVGRMLSGGMSFGGPRDVEKVISSYFRMEAYDRLDVFLEHIKSYYKLTRSTYDLLIAGYRRAGLTQKLDLVISVMKSAGL